MTDLCQDVERYFGQAAVSDFRVGSSLNHLVVTAHRCYMTTTNAAAIRHCSTRDYVI